MHNVTQSQRCGVYTKACAPTASDPKPATLSESLKKSTEVQLEKNCES